MILESQLILPNRRATRFRLKNPISPQFRAPIIEIVSAKQFRNLFPIDAHPFLVVVIFSIPESKKNIRSKNVLRIFFKN